MKCFMKIYVNNLPQSQNFHNSKNLQRTMSTRPLFFPFLGVSAPKIKSSTIQNVDFFDMRGAPDF